MRLNISSHTSNTSTFPQFRTTGALCGTESHSLSIEEQRIKQHIRRASQSWQRLRDYVSLSFTPFMILSFVSLVRNANVDEMSNNACYRFEPPQEGTDLSVSWLGNLAKQPENPILRCHCFTQTLAGVHQ